VLYTFRFRWYTTSENFKWRNKVVNIPKWIVNNVHQIIGTTPLEDFNEKTLIVGTPITDTEEKIAITRRISLSAEEKMYIEHTIFSAPSLTTRQELLDLIVAGIPSISGVKREKSTIKYYIYDGIERKKPENRPYRLLYGRKQYSIAFKEKAIQEAIKLGREETQHKFALPSATLAGWLDKYTFDAMVQKTELLQEEQEQDVTTKDNSPVPQTDIIISGVDNILQQNTTTNFLPASEPTPKYSPIDNKEATEILNALIQMQSSNKKLIDQVQLHVNELAKTKKQLIVDFEIKEKSCEQLISMVTANEANIEGALDTLAQIETATQKTKKAREATMNRLGRENARLRNDSGKINLKKEQINRDLQEVVRKIPKV